MIDERKRAYQRKQAAARQAFTDPLQEEAPVSDKNGREWKALKCEPCSVGSGRWRIRHRHYFRNGAWRCNSCGNVALIGRAQAEAQP